MDERKGRDLTQSYDKSPYTNRKIQKATWQHKKRHQKLWLHNHCGPTWDGQFELDQLKTTQTQIPNQNFWLHNDGSIRSFSVTTTIQQVVNQVYKPNLLTLNKRSAI